MGALGVKTKLDLLVEKLVEKFIEDLEVNDYVTEQITEFAEGLGFEPLSDALTELQQEAIGQYQLTVYHSILAHMISTL